MAMQWIDDVRQTAIIDEAERLAMRHLQEPFESVREKYALVGFDVVAFSTELAELCAQARDARAISSSAQARYEMESSQSRQAVEDAEKWFEQIFLIARYAALSGHPLGPDLERYFNDLDAESWSKGMDSVITSLRRLEDEGYGLTSYGLPADFIERSRTLAARLQSERFEATEAESRRMTTVRDLRKILDQIVAAFERISAARDAVMSITGEELPGLELSLVRGAAAPQPSPAPAAAAADATGL